jgi:hypothetical protein
MASGAENELPNIGETLARVLARVPRERQPLLIALAERLAAVSGLAEGRRRTAPRRAACADREEDIARRIEGLYPDADATQRELIAQNPDLGGINRALRRPPAAQHPRSGGRQRLGAATWRSFAKHTENAAARTTWRAPAPKRRARWSSNRSWRGV